jgi:uncharacterized protein YqgQ
MLTIDMVSNDVVTRIGDAVANINEVEVGGALLVLGVVLTIAYDVRRWLKQKGYRMVLKDRNDKIYAFLADGLTDLIENGVVIGKISSQEAQKLYADLQKKLGINDLVPTQRLAGEVKTRLKTQRILREKLGDFKPKIPGDKPPPVRKTRVS